MSATGETVYAADFFGDTLFAMDASDGSEVWSVSYNGSTSSPTVYKGSLYIGDADGFMRSYDAIDGSQNWSTDLNPNSSNSVRASPVLINDSVYVGSENDIVYSLSQSDGSINWSYSADFGVSGVEYKNGSLYVVDGDGILYDIDASDGSENWKTVVNSYTANSVTPAVSDGYVLVGTEGSGEVHALNASDGSSAWSVSIASEIPTSLIVDSGTVFVPAADFNGNGNEGVHALDITDGSTIWNYNGGNMGTEPTYWKGDIIAGEYTNSQYFSISASDGSQNWTFPYDNGGGRPTVLDNVAYINDTGGNVYAIDTTDGTQIWVNDNSTRVDGGPTVVTDPAESSYGSRIEFKSQGHHDIPIERTTSSDLIFVEGDAVFIENASHTLVFDEDTPVTDNGDSSFVFITGTGVGVNN